MRLNHGTSNFSSRFWGLRPMSAKIFLTSCDVWRQPRSQYWWKKTWLTAENAKKWPIPGKLKEWKMYNVSYRKENLALIIYTFIPTSLEILFINLGGALVNQCEIDLRLVDIRIVSNYSISNGNRENAKKKHAKSIFGTLTLLWDVVGIMSHTYYIPRFLGLFVSCANKAHQRSNIII